MNIKDYENKVVECLMAQQDEIILNNDIGHAEILIKQMFLNATNTVNLLSNKLDADLYEKSEIINAIRSFLGRQGTILNIAIEKDIDSRSVQLQKLFAEFDIQPTVIPEWLRDQYAYNFITIDDTGYRFESDRQKHKAVVNFGDREQTSKLNHIFQKILELASR